ncbi:MAG: phage tail assembly protein [Vallitaleaceae bacterium]|nr:phage tail assembly protein [Vallitaleaceae bacterium]
MNNEIKKEKVIVDADEFAVAEKEAENSEYTYIHKFKKPFVYQGKTYNQLTFEWDKLTGKDGLTIENEMQQVGKAVIVPTFSGEYLIRLAARACTEPIASDAFELMKIADYNKIRSAARSFLLKSEL